MINLSFASLKNPKEVATIKQQIIKKNQMMPMSFKAVGEAREHNKIPLHHKKLDNQENTLTNITNIQHFPRKNHIKVDSKSNKKINNRPHIYKSPIHKPTEHSKILQQSNYCPRIYTQRHQEPINAMTPNLAKNTKSFTLETQAVNNSYFTQRQRTITDSEQGSIGSCENSLNDSFMQHPNNVSYEEDDRGNFAVVNSLELQRQCNNSYSNKAYNENEFKSMKKSMYIGCSNQPILKDLENTSVNGSVSSSYSMKMSQKFKHYKKKPTKWAEDSAFSMKDFIRLKEIGSGKYGKVYSAIHRSTGFLCALKSVSKRIIRQQKLEIPFMRQVKIQLYLNHPNIVKLYGLFHDSENVYLIMEYCSDSHLYKLIRQRKEFTQTEIVDILSNIYEGVANMHSNGIIHRDIKPQNVVIEHGVYKLCDFGWAAYACGDTRTTFCGTPLYVCPQVLKGQEYNQKADIWGLGIVSYELTFGRVPFTIMNPNDLMKIITDPVYFPVRDRASQKLVPIVRRMLSKNAEERPCLNEILSNQLFATVREYPRSAVQTQLKTLL